MRVTRPPYNPEDPLSINVTFWCRQADAYKAFMLCPLCDQYRCRQLAQKDIDMLARSPLMLIRAIDLKETILHQRSKRMYIAEYEDGGLKLLEKFNPQSPAPGVLEGVVRVHVVTKTLEPRISLVPAPKSVRDKVVAAARAKPEPKTEAKTETTPAEAAPKKKRKSRAKAVEAAAPEEARAVVSDAPRPTRVLTDKGWVDAP